jgi:sec-independent protein translocase protein TatA
MVVVTGLLAQCAGVVGLVAMFGLGPLEILVIGAIAVMLYGKRLPEVGRSVGQSLAELRRQWTTLSRELDVSRQIDAAARGGGPGRRIASNSADDDGLQAGPAFDPPPAEPPVSEPPEPGA